MTRRPGFNGPMRDRDLEVRMALARERVKSRQAHVDQCVENMRKVAQLPMDKDPGNRFLEARSIVLTAQAIADLHRAQHEVQELYVEEVMES